MTASGLQPKRIALFIMSLQPGGAERVISKLANHWADKGHKVTLVTLAAPGKKPFYPLNKAVTLLQLSRATQQPFLGGSKLQQWLVKQTWGRRLLKVQAILRLRSIIKQLKPDVIVSFIDLMNMVVLIASKGLEIPVIVSERIDPNHHHIFILLRKLRALTYSWASKIVVQTRSAKSYFCKTPKDKLSIIPNAVAAPTIKTSKSKIPLTRIVAVGRLDSQKDHSTLIHAFAGAVLRQPQLRLTIYGEGKERSKLERLIQTLGLTKQIQLPGVIPDIEAALLDADLFVFPSRYEGFPNALGEAMSLGLPVIASNCSGNTDLIRDGIDGRLFSVGDTQSLTNLILELCDDPKQLQNLGGQAQKVTERFCEEKIYALWDRLIGSRL
ncbi:MAG: glycosyltransferase family 4 protein [Pseudomonadota bacterium]